MMAGEIDSPVDEDDTQDGGGSVNGVRLPRVNLANVIEVLEKAYQHGRSPSITQVSAALDQSLKSGAFRTRMAAAAHFGLVDAARGRVQITDLGMRVLDDDLRPAALAEAWMQVPVFKALFDRFDGNRLPPSSGVEAELKILGVPAKNVALARRVLISSAETAGILNAARDRLVEPTFRPTPTPSLSAEDEPVHSPARSRFADTAPVELDFGDAGRIELAVDIDWLALQQDVFIALRATIEKLKELAATERRTAGAAPTLEAPADDDTGGGGAVERA